MIARIHRRQLLQAAAASTAAAAFSAPMLAQGAGLPVVVIGGGFGGASCARALRKADPRIAVTLVEANATYTALPHSNAVIGGLVELSTSSSAMTGSRARTSSRTVGCHRGRSGQARSVTLADGTKLNYERLVVVARHRFPLRRDPGL